MLARPRFHFDPRNIPFVGSRPWLWPPSHASTLPPSTPRQSTDIRPSLSTRRSRFRYTYIFTLCSIVARERGRVSTNGDERCRISTSNDEQPLERYTIMTILTERLKFFSSFFFFRDQDSTEDFFAREKFIARKIYRGISKFYNRIEMFPRYTIATKSY